MATGLLGIDIGTTGVRAALFEPTGRKLGDATVACPYDAPAPGRAEIDPERWWAATKTVLASLAEQTSLDGVAAIAVVGQAPTAVLVDASGAPIGPALLWLDTRATDEATELGTHAYYLGPKLLWLARNARERLARTATILQSHAFLTHRLTGVATIDPSTAALGLPLFDLASREWLPDACARVGIRAAQLPRVSAASAVAGPLLPAAASALGLRAGIPVVGGGGDFAAATLGAGVIEEGEACLMLGTAGNLLVPRRSAGTDPRLINAHHVGAETFLSLGGTLSGGAQEWLRRSLSAGSAGEPPSFEALDAEAAAIPAGSEGLLFLPYLQGERTPIWNTHARGAFLGLGLEHGRGHLWRALLEGIALSFADCQEVLEQAGVRLASVVAANGGGKSALFRQILCDALGVPLSYTAAGGGTVAGAALLAGLGTGLVASPAASRAWRGPSIDHAPSGDAHALYRRLLPLRRTAYASLEPLFPQLKL